MVFSELNGISTFPRLKIFFFHLSFWLSELLLPVIGQTKCSILWSATDLNDNDIKNLVLLDDSWSILLFHLICVYFNSFHNFIQSNIFKILLRSIINEKYLKKKTCLYSYKCLCGNVNSTVQVNNGNLIAKDPHKSKMKQNVWNQTEAPPLKMHWTLLKMN